MEDCIVKIQREEKLVKKVRIFMGQSLEVLVIYIYIYIGNKEKRKREVNFCRFSFSFVKGKPLKERVVSNILFYSLYSIKKPFFSFYFQFSLKVLIEAK